MPLGTLGIYKCSINVPANGKAVLPFNVGGLYLYKNASWSHYIGTATLDYDGRTNVIIGNPHCLFGEQSTEYPYIVKDGSDVVAYNPTNADKLLFIVVLSL